MTDVLIRMKELQKALAASSSSKLKVQTLRDISTDAELVLLIKYIYDPDMKFNVTSKRILDFKTKQLLMISKMSLFGLLEDLYTRKITGHTALEHVNYFLKKNVEHTTIILNILDKDLKVGINQKIINKALDNLIPEFSVALGKVYEEKYIKDHTWLVSQKLDGIRCICIITEKNVKFYSRMGKELFIFDNIKKEITSRIPCVLDGEMIDGDGDFQQLMKGIHRKDHTIVNPIYNVFDNLTPEEFWSKKSNRILSERLSTFTLESFRIKLLSQRPYSELSEMMDLSKENNWEGLIVRKDNEYKGSRSNDVLKVKEFFTEEYTVESIEVGNMRTYNKQLGNYHEIETLSAVRISHNGCNVRVGSGFSMAERQQYYESPEDIIGKIIAVRYFEETHDQNGNCSLRFPTFRGCYGESRTV
jgi:DNA ligase-1